MKKSKAFTLIELLIVMAVITIMIAIAIPSFKQAQDEARKQQGLPPLYSTQTQRDIMRNY